MKQCKKCNTKKPLTEYYKYNGSVFGKCKECYIEDRISYYQENREEILIRTTDYHYRKNYGITKEEFDALVIERGGCCEVCGSDNVVLDHCHTHGHIRGVLCNKCNTALGLLQDDISNIVGLAVYLDKYKRKE